MMAQKVPYICGPLTELDPAVMVETKKFYERLGDLFEDMIGERAFVPHEHYDPIKSPHFTPPEVDVAERQQVYHKTSLLVVVPVAPSWGGGIEVEMANQHGVPVVLLCEREKLKAKKISRLLMGNPAVQDIIEYNNYDDALCALKEWMQHHLYYLEKLTLFELDAQE